MQRASIALFVLLAACQSETAGSEPEAEPWYFPVLVPEILDREPKPSQIVYLNREGATLIPGTDEASLNRSSIVLSAERESFTVPAFRGSARRWDDIVACIRGHFEPYEVEIVEQRPTTPGYLMAVMGGRPSGLGATGEHDHGRVTGLSPFSGQPVENAVVLIFTRELRERTRATCETAAMEIAHAYGLDHTRSCRDLMTYRRRCGARSFRDDDMECGERSDRPCSGERATQNSHRMLLDVLTARGSADEDPDR